MKTLAGVKDEISSLHSMQIDFGKFESLVGDLKLGDLPSFDIFGIDMSQNPEIALNWLILIPILNFAVSLFSSMVIRKLSYQPPKTNQTREAEMSAKIMTLSMPLLSVWITFSVPAVIGIYWIYQNLLGILQQFIMSKIYPIPRFTEEDYRQAELQLKGKTDKKKKKAERDPNRPRVRSLHYIDDEEYNAKVVDNPAPDDGKKVSSPFIEPIQTKDYSSDKKNGKKK